MGAVLWLDDCHLDSAKFMTALHNHLQKRGVKFLLNSEVVALEKTDKKITAIFTVHERIETEELIIASGSWMPESAKLAGIDLLMQPGKGYSMVYDNLEKNLRHPAILVEARTAMTPIDRWLRIGGTMELSGHSD